MRIVFLGTGTSHGIPVVTCGCAVCNSSDPRDTRYRSSVAIFGDHGERVLIDAGPEFRLQAIRAKLERLDAVLVTHAHADHIHGLDDVRPLTKGKPLPIYASAFDVAELRERFSYAFKDGQMGGGKPKLELWEAPSEGATVGSIRAIPIPVMHGERRILGYRLGKFAYLTDCSAVPAESVDMLRGLDTLVIGALRKRPHPTHFTFDQALELAAELRPSRAFLTHICHDMSHAEIDRYCQTFGLPFPAGPAWDGLEIEV